MIYFFYGAEPFLLRQKINSEISRYRAKHKSGLNFSRFNFVQEQSFSDFKNFIDSFSMFAEKKLAIIENLFEAPAVAQQDLVKYLGKSKILKDQERFLIIVQELRLNDDKKKKEKYILKDIAAKELFKKLASQEVSGEEFNLLEGARLEAWIKKEVAAQGGQIDNLAIKKLAASVGPDLWQMQNEVTKLISFKADKPITADDVDILVKSKIESDIFKTIDALAARQKISAFKFLYRNLTQGESETSLLGMLVYQFRNLLMVKDLIEQGIPFYNLAKKIKLHPYVLRKTYEQSKNFSYAALKKIYERLMEIDLAIKSGQIEPRAALDLIVAEITG